MAGPISLEFLDPVDLDQTGFGDQAKQWLTNVVDIINASFTTLNNAFAHIFAMGQTDIGGGGAGPLNVVVTGLMASNFVSASLVSSSNPVTILSVVPGVGSFNITFSADPGASAIIVYQAFTTQPQ